MHLRVEHPGLAAYVGEALDSLKKKGVHNSLDDINICTRLVIGHMEPAEKVLRRHQLYGVGCP